MNPVDYEKLRKTKESVTYNTIYSSSTVTKVDAELGTIERDSSGYFGKFSKENFRGEKIFNLLYNLRLEIYVVDCSGVLCSNRS